ncbi:MAG TPA: hypothetical protein DDZ83_04450 [Nitrospinae bacterium]|nr:hypothetical protein [Nitrospinota bacterium]
MSLTEVQVRRYSRHILLPQVGGKGQERLLSSSAVIAFDREGEGAASVAATYLAASGVGRIGWMLVNGGNRWVNAEGSLSPLAGIYASAGLEESAAALNPDAVLEVIDQMPDAVDGFDLLILSGDDPTLGDAAARFEAAGGPVVRGRRCGWAGAVTSAANDPGFDELLSDDSDSRLPAAPSEGVLGAMLASRALCALIKQKQTVGSTVLARYDLSFGFFSEAAR